MALMYLPLYLLLLGICSAFLWLPALGVGIGLLVLRPNCRRKLGVLFGMWGLSLVLLLRTVWAESNLSVRLRNWVYTVPVYFWGAASVVLLIAVAWYAVQHFPRKWIARLVKVGCALSLFAVFTVGFFIWCLSPGQKRWEPGRESRWLCRNLPFGMLPTPITATMGLFCWESLWGGRKVPGNFRSTGDAAWCTDSRFDR